MGTGEYSWSFIKFHPSFLSERSLNLIEYEDRLNNSRPFSYPSPIQGKHYRRRGKRKRPDTGQSILGYSLDFDKALYQDSSSSTMRTISRTFAGPSTHPQHQASVAEGEVNAEDRVQVSLLLLVHWVLTQLSIRMFPHPHRLRRQFQRPSPVHLPIPKTRQALPRQSAASFADALL